MSSASTHGGSKRFVVAVFAAAALLAVAPAALPLSAQDRTQLVRILESDMDFRVRVQAAFALGNTRDAAALDPLVRALADPNPAVRAASAAGLARLGNPRALTALRNLNRDSSAAVRLQAEHAIRQISERGAASPVPTAAPVPPGGFGGVGGVYPRFVIAPTESSVAWGSVRYVVFVGSLENRSGYQGPQLTVALRREVSSNLHAQRNLAVLDDANNVPADHVREITRRHLPKLRLDGALRSVNRRTVSRQLSIRCEVSFMLLDEPERVMRGILNGAATGSDDVRSQDQERRLAEQALAGAVRSALSGVSSAIEQATRRR